MPGVEAHLTSPLQQVHTLGMVVAELLINLFDPSGEKLKFEVNILQSLIVPLTVHISCENRIFTCDRGSFGNQVL